LFKIKIKNKLLTIMCSIYLLVAQRSLKRVFSTGMFYDLWEHEHIFRYWGKQWNMYLIVFQWCVFIFSSSYYVVNKTSPSRISPYTIITFSKYFELFLPRSSYSRGFKIKECSREGMDKGSFKAHITHIPT